jgi:hypothetical protein
MTPLPQRDKGSEEKEYSCSIYRAIKKPNELGNYRLIEDREMVTFEGPEAGIVSS